MKGAFGSKSGRRANDPKEDMRLMSQERGLGPTKYSVEPVRCGFLSQLSQRANMRRREFLTILSGAAMAPLIWPGGALAQQPRNPSTIGFLGTTTPTIWSANVTAFQHRLRELDWIDGRNVSIEYRWAQGNDDRYAEFASEFAQRKVDIIVTAGTTAVIALKKATSAIPIVFAAAGDPVRTGLVSSLSRPGGNVTGLSNQQTDLGGRRLALLREILPSMKRVAVLGNFGSPLIALEMEGVKADAAKLGLDTFPLEVTKAEEIVPGLQGLNGVADALYICSDPFLTTYRVRINTLAIAQKLPTINAFREYVVAGGLLSYGPNFPDLFRRSADYVDKILRGAKPADIPVEQPVKFDLVINNTTAKAIGLIIPEQFLLRADEVIE
jgi:putative ABC transport system substrate-binding protein